MKPRLPVLLAAAAAAMFSISAGAMPSGAAGKGPSAHPMDCAKAKDKARCETLNKNIAACKDKTGDEWRACMHMPPRAGKFTPPKLRDCDKARNKERCEAHNAALKACADAGASAAHRKCMAGQLPAPAGKKD